MDDANNDLSRRERRKREVRDRIMAVAMKRFIRQGFDDLRPGEEVQGLADSAYCRARSDWLIGMNATRALTKRFKSRKEKTSWSAGVVMPIKSGLSAKAPRPFRRRARAATSRAVASPIVPSTCCSRFERDRRTDKYPITKE